VSAPDDARVGWLPVWRRVTIKERRAPAIATTDRAATATTHDGHHDHTTWRVFCFADSAHAARFRKEFGGEPFDPRDRGRGAAWAQWRKPVGKPQRR
jgi:hypothetical protein